MTDCPLNARCEEVFGVSYDAYVQRAMAGEDHALVVEVPAPATGGYRIVYVHQVAGAPLEPSHLEVCMAALCIDYAQRLVDARDWSTATRPPPETFTARVVIVGNVATFSMTAVQNFYPAREQSQYQQTLVQWDLVGPNAIADSREQAAVIRAVVEGIALLMSFGLVKFEGVEA